MPRCAYAAIRKDYNKLQHVQCALMFSSSQRDGAISGKSCHRVVLVVVSSQRLGKELYKKGCALPRPQTVLQVRLRRLSLVA